MTPPSTLTPDQEAALLQIEATYLADIAAGYTREEARLRRREALLALNLESEDESEFGL